MANYEMMGEQLGRWFGSGYRETSKFFGDVGEAAGFHWALVGGGDEYKAGAWQRMREHAKIVRETQAASRALHVNRNTAFFDTSIGGLAKARMRALVPIASFTAGLGVLASFLDPEENVMSGALRGAATGIFWNIAGPLAALDVAVNVGSALIKGGANLARDDNMEQITSGLRRYHPVEPSSPESGNLRRRSLMYMASSRANTQSFLGSEASSFHD